MKLGFAPARAALFAAGVLASGCDRFVPRSPVTSQTPSVRARLLEVRSPGPPHIAELALQTWRAARVGKVWVTSPLREPCTGGAEVTDVRVDGLESRRSLRGAHTLTAVMPFAALADERVLDVQIDADAQRQCLRVPVLSRVQSYARTPSVILSGGLEAEVFPVHGENGLFAVSVGAGYADRSVRGRATIGAGGATCDKEVCGSDDGKSLRSGFAIPARAQIDAFPLSIAQDVGWLAVGVGARYSVVHSRVPGTSGEYGLWSHGVHGVLGFVTGGSELPPGFRTHPAGGSQYAVEIPLGVWTSTHADRTETEFGGGLSIRIDAVP